MTSVQDDVNVATVCAQMLLNPGQHQLDHACKRHLDLLNLPNMEITAVSDPSMEWMEISSIRSMLIINQLVLMVCESHQTLRHVKIIEEYEDGIEIQSELQLHTLDNQDDMNQYSNRRERCQIESLLEDLGMPPS